MSPEKALCSVAAAMTLLACGGAGAEDGPPGAPPDASPIVPDKSLLIISPEVVTDPDRTVDPGCAVPGDEDKVWTIGHLLKREAEKNDFDLEVYAQEWMAYWTAATTVNDQTVPRLHGPALMSAWESLGGPTIPFYAAPFYLVAIANRIDLGTHRPFGEPLGGEVRFIFGMVAESPEGAPACPSTTYLPDSTVILEYSPVKADENQVRDFARRWAELSSLSGAEYRAGLEALTEEVVNEGRLLRVRINETMAVEPDSGANLTEFAPEPSAKFLARATLEQSPTMALAGGTSSLLSEFISTNQRALSVNALDGAPAAAAPPIGDYVVPDVFAGTDMYFRGSINTMGESPDDDFWNAPAPDGSGDDWIEARFRFSVGTCNGCHGRETRTSFLHVRPRGWGVEAELSDFLKGPTVVEDPVYPGRIREFDEIARRATTLRRWVDGLPVPVPVFGNNYELKFTVDERCLESSSADAAGGGLARVNPCAGDPLHRVALLELAPGVASLSFQSSGKCLEVQDGSVEDGAPVIESPCDPTRPSQRLSFELVETAGRETSPRIARFEHSGRCLAVGNGADGAPVLQGSCDAAASRFDLIQ